jgi:hypothetical protein
LCALALPAASLAQAQPNPAEFTRTCAWTAQDPMVDAVIAGQPVRLRVDFGAHAPILLSAAAAERLALASDVRPGEKKKPDRGVVVSRVGRKTVRMPWSRETVTIDDVTRPIPVLTPPAYMAGQGDGSISPQALPCGIVRLDQRIPGARDAETLMRVLDDGAFDGLRVKAAAGAEDIRVEFVPWRRESLGTAATGGVLVSLLGGSLTGPVVDVPVVYGVTRPARLLRLDQPWRGVGIRLPALMMRVSDWEGDHAVPRDGDLDPELIQVTKRRNPQRGQRLLQLGRDVLGDCARFEWRRQGNMLAVHCPAP